MKAQEKLMSGIWKRNLKHCPQSDSSVHPFSKYPIQIEDIQGDSNRYLPMPLLESYADTKTLEPSKEIIPCHGRK